MFDCTFLLRGEVASPGERVARPDGKYKDALGAPECVLVLALRACRAASSVWARVPSVAHAVGSVVASSSVRVREGRTGMAEGSARRRLVLACWRTANVTSTYSSARHPSTKHRHHMQSASYDVGVSVRINIAWREQGHAGNGWIQGKSVRQVKKEGGV